MQLEPTKISSSVVQEYDDNILFVLGVVHCVEVSLFRRILRRMFVSAWTTIIVRRYCPEMFMHPGFCATLLLPLPLLLP